MDSLQADALGYLASSGGFWSKYGIKSIEKRGILKYHFLPISKTHCSFILKMVLVFQLLHPQAKQERLWITNSLVPASQVRVRVQVQLTK